MKKNLVLIILYLSFISIGLPDQVLGIAWPNMRLDFNQTLDKAGIIIALITLCSALSGYLSGYMLTKFNLSKIIITSYYLIIIGLVGYIISNHWIFILISCAPFGFGLGAIDVILNNYAAKNLYSKHINWLHGFWGIGATLGPMIFTGVYALNLSWRFGFIIIVICQVILLSILIKNKSIWDTNEIKIENDIKKTPTLNLNTFLSSVFFGVYVTLETSVGLWYYSYLTDYKNLSFIYAGGIISAYWAVFTFGRFIIGYLTKWFSDKTIVTTSIISSVFLLIFVCFDFYLAIIFVGFSFSGIFPCMVNETHKRFKPKVADALMGQQIGSSYLALVALVPFIGHLSEEFGLKYLSYILISLALILLGLDLKLRNVIYKK